MTSRSYDPPSPDLTELMRFYRMDENDCSPARDQSHHSQGMPPAPSAVSYPTKQRHTKVHHQDASHIAASPPSGTDATDARTRCGAACLQPTGAWNSSTQVVTGTAKPLKHQILCRNFVPPAPIFVERKTTNQLLHRISKATISSRMKGSTVAAATRPTALQNKVEVDRKRLHLQQKQAAHMGKKETAAGVGDPPPDDASVGREAIQLLLFYRKEVEKRLRADPMYALQQDLASPN